MMYALSCFTKRTRFNVVFGYPGGNSSTYEDGLHYDGISNDSADVKYTAPKNTSEAIKRE